MTGLKDLLRIERARHFLVALAIAATLGAVGFFGPADWLIWNLQAQTFQRPASGEIVYVESAVNLADPAFPEERVALASLINRLDEAGASKIFLDVRLRESTNARADETLAAAIERSDRIFLVDRYSTTVNGTRMLATTPTIGGRAERVIAKELVNPFGWTWKADFGSSEEGDFRPSFAATLAGVTSADKGRFRIDYSIDYRSIPSVPMATALSSDAATRLFEDKLVVIGNGGSDESNYRAIPGYPRVPASMVGILAAETLLAGPPLDLGWVPTFAAFAVLTGLLAFVPQPTRQRRFGYLIISAAVPLWLAVSIPIGVTTYLSVPIAFLALYGALRFLKVPFHMTAPRAESKSMPSFRARHFVTATLVALALGVTGFLAPLDWLIWASHARIFQRPASGEIVFVGGTDDLRNPAKPSYREELAKLIEGLNHAGASRIFLDVRLEDPSEPSADMALASAIERSRRTYLVERYTSTLTGPRMLSTIPSIAGSAPRVSAKQWTDPFGWVWSADLGSAHEGTYRQSFAAALGGAPAGESDKFRIDYSIDYRSVPSFSMPEAQSAIDAGTANELFAGKFVVIGNGGTADSAYAAIPGQRKVPASMVAILAGETLRAGIGTDIGWLGTLAFFCAFMALVLAMTRNPRSRHWGYTFVSLSVPAWFLLSAQLRMTAHLAVPIAFLVAFGVARAWNIRSRAAAVIDEVSGLPNFRALEKDLARRPQIAQLSVVVARVHRFDEVVSILPSEGQAEYVRLIADRFRITDEDLTVYSNSGRYLAWVQECEDEQHLEAHLRGLRAVFANPLQINGTAVDVGITFGADATREASPARKIALATAAADKTTEADNPVVLVDPASTSDRLWNVSLQAKIDAALKSGEIYVVYQPQFHLPTGRLTGFEALVRWNDPERGSIPPSYFIEQCEHVGRMEALTRKVIRDTVEAIGSAISTAPALRFSINVSATLLDDSRLVRMLEDALVGTHIEPSRITLEITETARIADYDKARTVLSLLRSRGFRVSIDDFGVGAASFETLLRLPFDELKIDRDFVSRIREDDKARHIVESLIQLCKGLGLEVVAEGVEDHATLEILTAMGCEIAQGYVLGRPAALEATEELGRHQRIQRSTA